jgi:hypothetical protein
LEVQADDAEALDITGEAETNGDKGDRNRKGGRGVVKNKGLEKKRHYNHFYLLFEVVLPNVSSKLHQLLVIYVLYSYF